MILFSDHLTTITRWRCLIFQLVISRSTEKYKKKQRKQRKNCQIKVDIIFSAFGAGEDEVERVILIFIKKPLIDNCNRANSR